MILYEVNIRVLDEIAERYATWLASHIPEIVEIEGFESAEWFIVAEDSEAAQMEAAIRDSVRLDESIPADIREAVSNPVKTTLFSVQYRLTDEEAYNRYLREHAPAMKQEGIDLFGSKFAASRRLMILRESY